MSTVNLKIAATDDASRVIDRVHGKLTDLSKPIQGNALAGFDLSGLERVAGTLGGLMGGGGLGALLGGAGVSAGLVGVGMATAALGELGAKAGALRSSFETMAGSAEDSADRMLAAMQQASGGTIADQDLMLAANRAMSYGVANSAAEMTSLIQLALTQSQKMGTTATAAFNDLVTGVGRLSPMILDNLGVVVKAEDAYARYAASVGKAADALNQTEQRQAFLNEMMRASPDAAAGAAAAIDSDAGAFARWDTSIKNLTESIGMLVAGPMADLVAAMTQPVSALANNLQNEESAAVIQYTQDLSRLVAMREALIGAMESRAELPFAGGEFFAEGAAEWDTPQVPEVDNTDALRTLEELEVRIQEVNRLRIEAAQWKPDLGAGYAEAVEPWQNILELGDQWAAQQAAMQAQAVATADAITAEAQRIEDALRKALEGQIDSLTKGLIPDLGASGALAANEQLKGQLNTLIGLYQRLGMSSEQMTYSLIEWYNDQATAAKNAAAGARELEGATGSMAARQAQATGAVGAMTRALIGQANALRAASREAAVATSQAALTGARLAELVGGEAQGRNDRMADGFSRMADEMSLFAGAVGGGGGGAIEAVSSLQGQVESLLSGALDVGVGVDPAGFLPREDAINEDARRLADVMVNGFGSPWASYFQSEFPALFAEMTAGGDIQAGAARLLQEFEAGLRPELINQDAVKDRVKAMLVGDANMAALAAEITAELEAELAGADPAQIAGLVNGALGMKDTGAGAGIEEELNNEAFLGKLSGAGQKGGQNWGKSFIAYVQANVPFELVGLLTDLVTPQVRARLAENSSAEGPVN